MKLAVLAVLALIVVATNANFLSRKCKCTAVSDTIHAHFHSWELGSCKMCSCKDPAIENCKAFCQSTVESYAKSGCGLVVKGSKVMYLYEASTCDSGYGSEVYNCA